MARRGVIVRRLTSIENFGSMDVLCTDKTGTLTEGVVQLDGALDSQGQPSDEVLRYAYLNAALPDRPGEPAGRGHPRPAAPATRAASDKLDEIPYDFVRKRLSVVVDADPGTPISPC